MLGSHLNIFSLSGLLILCTFPILTILSLTNYRSKLHALWSVFNVAVGIWGLGAFLIGISKDAGSAYSYWKLAHVGIIFIPVLYFHVSYVFCELDNKKILFFLYVQAAFFLILNISDTLFHDELRYAFSSIYYIRPTFWYGIFFAIWLSTACAGTINYVLAYKKVKGIKKVQIKYFIAATIFGFSGGLTNFLPVFRIDIFPYGNLLLPIFPIVVTYAIIRYRLMDIDLVIKKGMVYSLSAGILTSLFVVLVITMTKYFSDVVHMTSSVITIIAALTISVLFHPLKEKIQLLIDKNFYKRTYNYYDVIRDISRKLTSIFDLNTINEFIANTIFDALGLNSIYVLSAEFGRNYAVVYQRFNKHTQKKQLSIAEQCNLQHNSEMIRFMIESEDILIEVELPAFEEKIGQDGIQRIRHELGLFGGEAAVPVFIEGQIALVLILGEKLSGDMFTREDINLLKTISDQIAIAAKNARLYKDKLDSEKLASVGMMAATFAHEVRNPLTSLKTFAQLMPEKYNDEEFRDGFSKIVVGEIHKIDDLIRDLLDFSAEKKSARVREYDLVGIVDETVEYVKDKLGLARKNVVIQKEYTHEPLIMMGDAKQVRQLFTNLVMNGCQAMNGEGTLRIEIHHDGETVDVSVADTGRGIHPDNIKKIFDPFVTDKDTGTGLGLSISKKIVEEHSGSLRVESRLSRGSAFTVTLPVQKK